VTEVRQKAKLALVALAGAAVGVALARFRRPTETPAEAPDDRAEELRRKLAEARAAFADEDDFEAAGMGAETVVEEPPPAAGTPEPPAEPLPKPKPKPVPPKAPTEPPPRDEFEAMRRRIHEEGKAAAEEMRRSTDTPEQP
jgi:hypothetical protein